MTASRPVAIVDIGSNSVRLVVYSGATRAPSIIFNEKVMAGLGRGLDATGALSDQAQARALNALGRFRLLVDRMGVVRTRVFATAAAREATNAPAFLDKVRALGFEPRILSGEEEGRLAGMGVISAIPDADGVVGDLGGGSLELADVAGGDVRHRISLPLGVLRIAAIRARTNTDLLAQITKVIRKTEAVPMAAGRPLYLVGGSWRSLARLDLSLTDHPLPVTHQHELPLDRPRTLQRVLVTSGSSRARELALSSSRIPTLPHANLLLRALIDTLRPGRLIVSAFGIREGLLYDDLDEETRRADPLIEAAREVGRGLGRFPEHGKVIDAWIAPVFNDDPASARLRTASCLLSDIGWAAHPDFRAERGIDMALHGNWVGIDAPGRVLMAAALFANFGGGGDLPYPRMAALTDQASLKRARLWGLAIRLAQRLSGGVADPLRRSSLAVDGGRLVLRLPEDDRALYGEAVERRLKTLANAMDLKPGLLVG